MALPEEIIDRTYRLHQQLGAGGMGAVFRATHLVSGREVALKLVAGAGGGPASVHSTLSNQRLRFALAREFQTLASLHHPNIVQVLSYGFDETHGPYLAMELLPTSQTILEAASEQPLVTKVHLIAQLLRALAFIHQRGVLHRDLKPSNVLVVQGEVKLLDFGVASRVNDGAGIAGTLAYMAPEILAHRPSSPASDLYSAGIVFFQMLTERFPYTADSITKMYMEIVGDSGEATMARTVARFLDNYRSTPRVRREGDFVAVGGASSHDTEPDAPGAAGHEVGPDLEGQLAALPSLPASVAQIVVRLLARHPSDRFGHASDVLAALADAVAFPLPAETAATRESFLKAAGLIGRDDELALLSESLSEAARRCGGALLVGGESGVGKSRLLSELRTQALVQRFWVVDGQCSREGGGHYHEWLPLLRALCFRAEPSDDEAGVLQELLPELGTLLGRPIPAPPRLPPEQAQSRLVETLGALLGRLDRPLLLLMEDLHWARSESLTLLGQLAPRLGAAPVLLVGSYRTDESPALPDALPAVQVVPLVRLGPDSIGRLCAAMLGSEPPPALIDDLYRHTEGNVFFLIEIVRALAEDAGALQRIGSGRLPEPLRTAGIERILEQRIDRVPAPYRPMLALAATLGRTLNLAALGRAFPAAEAPLRDFLFAAGSAAVLERQGDVWRFTHEGLRETILRHLPATERRDLHRRAAELLESLSAPDLSALIASHYDQAGLPEPAFTHYLRASERATRLSLYLEARVHLQAAERMLAAIPDSPSLSRSQVELAERQILTTLFTDKIDVQLARAERARQLLAELAARGGPDDADRMRQARLDYLLGRAHEYAGQPLQAIACYQRVLPIARACGDEELVVKPAYVIGSARSLQGELAEAAELLGQAIGPLTRIGTPFEQLRCTLYYALALSACGRYVEAIPYAEQARATARRLGQPSILAMAETLRAGMHRILADWPAALEAAEAANAVARPAGDKVFLFIGLVVAAWSRAYLGDREQSEVLRQEALALLRDTGGRLMAVDWFEGAQGEMALLVGDNEAALAIARELQRKSKRAGLVLSQGMAERIWACALGRLGGPADEVAAHFDESERIFVASGNILDIAQTRLWRGRSCRERGAHAEADRHFRAALDCFASRSSAAALAGASRFAEQS